MRVSILLNCNFQMSSIVQKIGFTPRLCSTPLTPPLSPSPLPNVDTRSGDAGGNDTTAVIVWVTGGGGAKLDGNVPLRQSVDAEYDWNTWHDVASHFLLACFSRCSVLQCVAVRCSVLQCVLQCVGGYALNACHDVASQQLLAHFSWYSVLQRMAAPPPLLQHTATHCNTLQHAATHCNTLQHTATHCNTPK